MNLKVNLGKDKEGNDFFVDFGKQKSFINLVEEILAITKAIDYLGSATKQARVRDLERQIDELVYKLYGLTDQEIKIVENK